MDSATYVANQVGVAERQRLAKREYGARRNVLKKAERALEGRARKIPPNINTNTTASAVECASSLLLQLSAPRALPIAPTISAASPHIVQTRCSPALEPASPLLQLSAPPVSAPPSSAAAPPPPTQCRQALSLGAPLWLRWPAQQVMTAQKGDGHGKAPATSLCWHVR